jgi:hypothetical protein
MHEFSRLRLAAVLGVLALPPVAEAGMEQFLKPLEGALGSSAGTAASTAAASALSQDQIGAGLKEALEVGVDRAIAYLGQDGGFLDDPQVKIPLPSMLQQLEMGLRTMGKGDLADEFVATMNHAAEEAVPKTAAIFGEAIGEMTLEDARAILDGPDDAATEYFRQNSSEQLSAAILPVVEQATEKAGVTSAYKQLVAGSGVLGNFMDSSSLDLDRYVTDKALDGLFVKLAQEEKLIRQNPAARSTELLKEVFGAGQ